MVEAILTLPLLTMQGRESICETGILRMGKSRTLGFYIALWVGSQAGEQKDSHHQ